MKVLFWLLYLPLLTIVAIFSVANRHDVNISFEPLKFELTSPVFIVVLAAVLLGLIVGRATAWISGGQSRRMARQLRRDNTLLERKLTAMQEKTHKD